MLTTKMDAAVYLAAAQHLHGFKHDQELFSCNAITWVGTKRHRDIYRLVFGFTADDCYSDEDLFLTAVEAFGDRKERKHFRVMLLCMMAAMCGDV